jgi:hypothetical protein
VAELVNAFIIHPRDPGSNLSIDGKYFIILLVSQLNSNLYSVHAWALFVNINVY